MNLRLAAATALLCFACAAIAQTLPHRAIIIPRGEFATRPTPTPTPTPDPYIGAHIDPVHPEVVILADGMRVALTPDLRARLATTDRQSSLTLNRLKSSTPPAELPTHNKVDPILTYQGPPVRDITRYSDPTGKRPSVAAPPAPKVARTYVAITPNGKKYHRPGSNCPSLRRSRRQIAVPLGDALGMGLTACQYCY